MDQLNVQRTWPPVPGIKKHPGTDTIEFIFHKEKPKYRREMYVRTFYGIRPQKSETHITRFTTGGNLIDYPGKFSTTIS